MLDLSRLRTYKVAELESIAREKLRELYPNYTIPVDIELLVEKLPHVDLDIYPALSANHKMLGMVGVDLDTGQLVIYIDDKLADEERLRRRYRMTVAEELAHIVLHYDVIAMAERPEDFVELQQHKRWDELRAKR